MPIFESLFAAALSNGTICNGIARDSDLYRWFGDRSNITSIEIAVKQAEDYANEAFKNLKKMKSVK